MAVCLTPVTAGAVDLLAAPSFVSTRTNFLYNILLSLHKVATFDVLPLPVTTLVLKRYNFLAGAAKCTCLATLVLKSCFFRAGAASAVPFFYACTQKLKVVTFELELSKCIRNPRETQ